jgi:CHAT domain
LSIMSSMLPAPPPSRVLRVLVVADPAEDARLPGAEAEGAEVANLFESFNAAYGPETKYRIEVVKLLGPLEASRTNVLRELMIHDYDVLHFAGHCIYDELEPAASGWWFGKGKRLTARELNRIDGIPRFIFSNAGGSNLAQSSSRTQNAGAVVNFAEAFLARGAANFIYPAWPVGDVPARQFVHKLYAGLLGLKPKAQRIGYEPTEQLPLNAAVREARLAAAAAPEGERAWGAYQHYGSRQFPFFARRHRLRR